MSDLDLGDRLRQESATLAPPQYTLDEVRRAGRRRRVVRWAASGAGVTAAALVAGFALVALPGGDPDPVPAAAPDIALIDWDVALVLEPDASVDDVLAFVAERGDVLETQVAPREAVFPPPPVDDSAVTAELTAPGVEAEVTQFVVLALAAGTDIEVVGPELESLAGVFQAIPSVEHARVRLRDHFEELRAGATVAGTDPEVVRPALGPAPAFDTSPLGEEIPLVTSAPVPPAFFGWAVGEDGSGRDPALPVVHVGSVDDVHLLLYGSLNGDRCDATIRITGAGGAGCGPVEFTPRYGSQGLASDGRSGVITVRVPRETAAVAVTMRAGAMWQRPAAGWALFPFTGSDPGQVEVVAYAADGSELGRWSRLR